MARLALAPDRDPIAGANVNANAMFTVPGASQQPFVFGLRTFVTARGGGYFLMPGIAAAKSLSMGRL